MRNMKATVPSIDVILIDSEKPENETVIDMCTVPRIGEVVILAEGGRAEVMGVEHDYQKPEAPRICVMFKRLENGTVGAW